ncbi:hypothetical protein [Desulfosporosinus sp. FKB]|uniref:hypothetical protein n=1 Tax=Desulfosporosinus sp. FKB TaxID=1969835 RepID=UPI000B4A34A2|nr:hypothetical protein [Desulfosporosinus sp. FKB]
MSDLNSIIRKYKRHNGEERFKTLLNVLHQKGIPRDIIEDICKSKHCRNKYHIGMFYLLGGRLLEASYYFQLHLLNNKDDKEVWVKLQYTSAKRGDLWTSSEAIKEICRLGNDNDINRAIAIHNLASGYIYKAEKAALLINNNNIDNFTIMIVLEVALTSRNWILISRVFSTEIGKQFLTEFNPLDNKIAKQICIERLINALKFRAVNYDG